MDHIEANLREIIDEIDFTLSRSKVLITDLKRKLDAETTMVIALKLSKDDVVERLRRHLVSLPNKKEQESQNREIDKKFLIKLPFLLEKI